jgi:hypothetical protein
MAKAAKEKPATPAKKGKPEAPEGRDLTLAKRQVKVTNLNHSPEKAGKELVEKVDVSLQMELTQADLDLWVEVRQGLASELLFDAEGNPNLPALLDFPLELQAEGRCRLQHPRGTKELDFDYAVLKKPHVELLFGRKAILSCQIRISPDGHLDELGKMRIEQAALFSFSGASVPDEDAEDQEELPL